jgi:hypothetical protein
MPTGPKGEKRPADVNARAARQLEIDASEIRFRAERRVGER